MMYNYIMRKYTEHTKKVMREYTAEWNKSIKQVSIKFKPSDEDYWNKWDSVPGKTNLEKIKQLLDKT